MWEGNHFQVIRDKACGNGEGLWGEVTSPASLGPVPAPVLLICLSAPGHHCLLFSLQPSVAAKVPRSRLIACRHRFTARSFCAWPCYRFGDKANGFRASHASCFFLCIYLSWKGRQDSQLCLITRPLVQPCRVTSATDQSNA